MAVASVEANDRIYLEVREVGRRINTEPGKSFLGMIKLAE